MLFHDTQVAEESMLIPLDVLFITNQCLKAGNFRCVLNEVRMLLLHMYLKCVAYLSKLALKEKKKRSIIITVFTIFLFAMFSFQLKYNSTSLKDFFM